ncbi:MAG: hypothetical protein K6T83_16715 [Alicyclobacillus sp.]|nr:hypothetical protein [Alicyclobacillus sp.]
MRYKQPQSQNGMFVFIFGALAVLFAFFLLVSFNADFFDEWTKISRDGFNVLAVILLGIAVIMGIVLAIGHFTGNRPEFSVGITHGILAVVGTISLIVSTLRVPRGTNVQISLILFLAAIAIGIVFFVYRSVRKSLPNALIVLHALLALVGYTFLLRG